MPRRLDFVHFQVGDTDVEVAFMVAHEIARRAAHTTDEAARSAGAKIRGAGASRPIRLDPAELAALATVIDAWQAEAETLRQLRERLP
jgi:hypothetical protein